MIPVVQTSIHYIFPACQANHSKIYLEHFKVILLRQQSRDVSIQIDVKDLTRKELKTDLLLYLGSGIPVQTLQYDYLA